MRTAAELAKVKDIHPHDMRKVITTWLAERLERAEVLDMMLHHARSGTTNKHYNFANLEGPLRDAFQRWANHVSAVTGQPQTSSNVVELKKAAS